MNGSSLDLLAPEFRLLCLAVRQAQWPGDGAALNRAIAAGPDWNLVVDGAVRHRVAPLVLAALRACPDVPEAALAAMQAKVAKAGIAALGQAAQLRRLSAAFAAADIPMLTLKGVVLSQQLHGSLATRQGGDLDLLVPPERFWDADQLLRDHGFRCDGARPPERLRAAYVRWAKDLSYVGHGVRVELHLRLTDNSLLLPCDVTDLWAGREVVALGGADLAALPRRTLPLYLCTHGAVHGWERLRWLTDMAVLLAKGDAQHAAMDEAEAMGLAPLMRRAAHLAHDWLGMPLGDPRLAWDQAAARALAAYVRGFSPGSHGGVLAAYGREARWRRRLHDRVERYRLKADWRYRLRQAVAELVSPADWGIVPLPAALWWLHPWLPPMGWLLRRLPRFGGKA